MEDDFSSVCATAAEPAKRRRLDGDGGGPCGVEGESEGEYTEQQQHEDEQDTYSKEVWPFFWRLFFFSVTVSRSSPERLHHLL